MSRAFGGVLLACALVLLALNLWGPWQTLPEPVLGSSSSPETESLTDSSSIEDGLKATAADTSENHQPRQRVESATPTEAGSTLEVVYASTQDPAVGAQVYLLDVQSEAWYGRAEEIEGLPLHERQLYLLAERFGTRFVTDSDGIVRLPPTKPLPFASIVHPTGWTAFQHLDKQKGDRHRIELQPRTEIAVRLMQINGGPIRQAAVNLASQMRNQEGRFSRGVTDDQGIARVRLTGHSVAFGLRAWDRITVRLQSPFARVDRHSIQRPQPGEEIPEFAYELGSLEIQLPLDLDLGGEAAKVLVQKVGERRMTWAKTRGTSVSFDNVPLGEEFTAQLSISERGPHFVAKGEGPRRSGELVTFHLQAWEGPPTLRFTLVDAEGEPRAGVRLFASRKGNGWGTSGLELETNEQGRALIPLEKEHENQPHELTLQEAGDKGWPQTEIDLMGGYPPGMTDLGEVILTIPPLLVSGKVVDPEGTPIEMATVLVDGYRQIDGRTRTFRIGGNPSDAEGKFVVRSRERSDKLRVRAKRVGWSSGLPVETELGTEDLILVMNKTGSFSFRVRMDLEKEDSPGFRLVCLDEGLQIDPEYMYPGKIADGLWLLEAEDLPASEYRLEVRCRRPPVVFRSVGPIVIPPGGEASIEDVDLRHPLRPIMLRVVDSAGQPVPDAHVRLLRNHRGWTSGYQSDDFGEFRFLHWGERVDVIVQKKGSGYLRMNDVLSDQSIVLEPVALSVSMGTDLSFLGEDHYLRLQIGNALSTTDGDPRFEAIPIEFGPEGGHREISIPCYGELGLQWEIGIRGEEPERNLGWTSQVADGASGPELRLEVPAKILLAMREWAKAQR